MRAKNKRRSKVTKPNPNITTVAGVDDLQNTEHAQQEGQRQARPTHSWLEKIGVTFDGAIVLFTLVLTVVSYLQWSATRDTLEIGQRAWVTTPGANLRPIPSVDQPLIVALDFINSGSSPALDTNYTIDIVVAEDVPPGPVTRVFEEATRSRVTLGRDGKLSAYSRSEYLLTTEQMAEVLKRTKRIYVAGEIYYRDIFGHQRQTSYCFMARTDGKSIIDSAMDYCPTRNAAN